MVVVDFVASTLQRKFGLAVWTSRLRLSEYTLAVCNL